MIEYGLAGDASVGDSIRSVRSSISKNGQQADETSAVFVSQQFPPDKSGHAARIRDMSSALADEGWDVTVLAPPPSFPPESFDRSWKHRTTTTVDGVTVNRLWTWQPTAADPGFLTRMAYYVLFAIHAFVWLLLYGRRYDVVVTTTPPISTGFAGFVTFIFGKHWVVDVRDLWIDASVSLGFITDGGLLERVSRRYQGFVLGRADRVAVTTTTLGERLCDQYGEELSSKIRLVPNGVDISRFQQGAENGTGSEHSDDEGAEMQERTIPDGKSNEEPFIVIYTGNIGHAQDLPACIDALSRLPERVELWLVGGGDAVSDLKEHAVAVGVNERVRFIGPVAHEEIPELLSKAHVGVAPLKDDAELAYAMPTKAYEYLGCGLPIVATGQGEIQRFIRDSGGGLHADNDAESVAAAIETLLDDPEFRTRAGQCGYEYVAARYDRTAIANRFDEQLRELCGQDGQRA